MSARVKRHLSPDDFGLSPDQFASPERTGAICALGWTDPREGYLIECELVHPKSSAGRTVVLRLTEKDRDDLLLMLRNEAIRARQVDA
jgi:hypothetical protein